NNRQQVQAANLAANFDINTEHPYKGFEMRVATEMPVDRLWTLLYEWRESGEAEHIGIPINRLVEELQIRTLASNNLTSSKGAGWAARLFEICNFDELPRTVMNFLFEVYAVLSNVPDDAAPVNANPPPNLPPLPGTVK